MSRYPDHLIPLSVLRSHGASTSSLFTHPDKICPRLSIQSFPIPALSGWWCLMLFKEWFGNRLYFCYRKTRISSACYDVKRMDYKSKALRLQMVQHKYITGFSFKLEQVLIACSRKRKYAVRYIATIIVHHEYVSQCRRL
jgi:hypothetical protein